MRKTHPARLAVCALFAALTAVLSQVAVPVGPVPINLATCSVLLAGALLGSKSGALSQAVYVLLGAAGVPVFAGFRGGVGALAGPTGGYIAGYVLAAWLCGFIAERCSDKTGFYLLAMSAGYAACMTAGTGWFMFQSGSGLAAAFTACVLPFLPGDAVKIALSATLARRLRPVIRRIMS